MQHPEVADAAVIAESAMEKCRWPWSCPSRVQSLGRKISLHVKSFVDKGVLPKGPYCTGAAGGVHSQNQRARPTNWLCEMYLGSDDHFASSPFPLPKGEGLISTLDGPRTVKDACVVFSILREIIIRSGTFDLEPY